jgi:serine/threonine protein kinase
MWALGIILFQLVASYNHPFPFDNVFAMAIAIKDKDPDLSLLPPTVSPFIKQTIIRLLDKNPESRPDAQTLVV